MNELKRIINDRIAENQRAPSEFEMAHVKEMIQEQWEHHVNQMRNETDRENIALDNHKGSCNIFDVFSNPPWPF